MKMFKIIAVAATLLAGVSAASAASPLSFGAIQSSNSASVLTVTDSEALLLSYDNDVDGLQARIQGNKWLVAAIERQGFSVDQIVGASGGENDLTLYAL